MGETLLLASPRSASIARHRTHPRRTERRYVAESPESTESWRRGRNYIRVGDRVRIAPSAPRRHDGFVATVRRIVIDANGTVTEVEVLGAPRGRPVAFRSVRADRVVRIAQTRGGDRVVTGRNDTGGAGGGGRSGKSGKSGKADGLATAG